MTPEGKVKEGVKAELFRLGIYPLQELYNRPGLAGAIGYHGFYFMPAQGENAISGVPDFILCLLATGCHARFAGIEAKATAKSKVQPRQYDFKNLAGVTGAPVLITHDPQAVAPWLNLHFGIVSVS